MLVTGVVGIRTNVNTPYPRPQRYGHMSNPAHRSSHLDNSVVPESLARRHYTPSACSCVLVIKNNIHVSKLTLLSGTPCRVKFVHTFYIFGIHFGLGFRPGEGLDGMMLSHLPEIHTIYENWPGVPRGL